MIYSASSYYALANQGNRSVYGEAIYLYHHRDFDGARISVLPEKFLKEQKK